MWKKLAFIFIILGLAGTVHAQCISSGAKTSDGSIITGRTQLCGIEVYTDGSNDAAAILYDNTTASGTVLVYVKVPAANHYGGIVYMHPIRCSTGIYLDITGTNASAIIYHK
jgi:hypothetical protein